MFPNMPMRTREAIPWRVFYAPRNTITANDWQTWTKPAGASWIFGWVLSGGGGGSRGFTGAQTAASAGGGPSLSITFLAPASLLPDTLFVRPGKGGAGATVTGAGTSGTSSYISAQPRLTAAIVGGGAGNGTGAAGVMPTTGFPLLPLLLYKTSAPNAGAAGAAALNAAGGQASYALHGGESIVSGGAGGGNGTGAGGIFAGSHPAAPDSAAAPGTSGGNGENGWGYNMPIIIPSTPQLFFPQLVFSGGAGGGGHTTGQAGNGGNGAYGCGGGGGGTGNGVGSVPGNGGDGGDGLIILGAF